ncbi:hypothetical protein E4U42_001506 [Claviceps africana]|uniref:SMP-30/Gluconolactonase/LRE-like region domain-containing protein n=1 Tax=Claviceps africana TaxID=83212 RepID=A0A8K0J4E0_9HYPO|nr:hypothetical protein E4U42_001506 [Claviceps africana]
MAAVAIALLALAGCVSSQPVAAQSRLIHQFPPGVWVENLAVRPNGNLLLTTLVPNASIYEVVNPAGPAPSTQLRFTIPSVNSLFGIAELSPDRFAVLAGNHTPTAGLPGQWAVHTATWGGVKPPTKASRAAVLPDAVLLNGAAPLPGNPDVVLAADSTVGVVFRVNVRTGRVDLVLDLPEMKPVGGTTYSIGINGLRVRDASLYFTNSATHALYRVGINTDGSIAQGARVETVKVLDASFADDFDLGPALGSTAWVATNMDSSVVAVAPGGQARVAAGGVDSPVIPSDTSCRFGRTVADANVLYVTTAGKGGEGAKVVAINVGTGT